MAGDVKRYCVRRRFTGIRYRDYVDWRRFWMSLFLIPLTLLAGVLLLYILPIGTQGVAILISFFLLIIWAFLLAHDLGHILTARNQACLDRSGLTIRSFGQTRRRDWDRFDVRWGTLNEDLQMKYAVPVRCLLAVLDSGKYSEVIAIHVPHGKEVFAQAEGGSEWKANFLGGVAFCCVMSIIVGISLLIGDPAISIAFESFGMGAASVAAINVSVAQVIRDKQLKIETLKWHLPRLQGMEYYLLSILLIASMPFFWGGLVNTLVTVVVTAPLIVITVLIERNTRSMLEGVQANVESTSVKARLRKEPGGSC